MSRSRAGKIKSIIGILLIFVLVLSSSLSSAQTIEITNGLAWLSSVQKTDGSFGNLVSFRDTTEVTDTFKYLNSTGVDYQEAITWIDTTTVSNNDYLARKIASLASSGRDVSSLILSLVSAQHEDGGWGLSSSYIQSDTLTTTLALTALKSANSPNQTVVTISISSLASINAISYLLSIQNIDGGFGFYKGDISNAYMTALALNALSQFKATFNLQASIDKAVAYLLTRQNTDGGFGSSFSTVYETALSYQALVRTTLDPTRRSLAISYLSSTQLPDGSWNEDPYSTALALRALSDARIISQTKIQSVTLSKVVNGVNQPSTTYMAYETVAIDVTTADPNMLLEVIVQDSQENIYSARQEGSVFFFDTQNLAPGTYTIVVRAIDPASGIIIDEQRSTFTIVATVAVSDPFLVITPGFTNVGKTEAITLTLSLTSRSNTQATLTIGHEVKSPSGTILNSGVTPLSLSRDQLSTSLILASFSYSFTESGNYPIQARILNGTEALALVAGSISAAPNIRIDPSKTLTPQSVLPDGDKRIKIDIHLEGIEQGP